MVERSRASGPWGNRVRFAPGGLAYTPGVVLVPSDQEARAVRQLERSGKEGRYEERSELLDGAYVRFTGVGDVLDTVGRLRQAGVEAQPDHVLFATCCCPPHPAKLRRPVPAGEERVEANPYYANPYYANPYYANPYYANPYYANPYYANAGSGCCCCAGTSANPYYANPYYANPYYANPYYANAEPNPALNPASQETGRRRSSARPWKEPDASGTRSSGSTDVRIAILDTGWAQSHAPTVLGPLALTPHGGDHPDEDGDRYLDPAAGHGTFIAGVIEQRTPGCSLELFAPLSSYGDGSETAVATTLFDLAARPDDDRPHLVNLSFGGYSPIGMAVLSDAIGALRSAGVVVVASAGNDATCRAIFPGALPGVVSVGAVDAERRAAPFTNYGPWVRACALGLDVVSIFFQGFDGAEPQVGGEDQDSFHGWAIWSGTSFAAPRVVGALAEQVANGRSAEDAVAELIDDPDRDREPMLGAYVD